jgi:hypothetical protein
MRDHFAWIPSKREDQLLARLERRYGLQNLEIAQLVLEVALFDLDPAPAVGEPEPINRPDLIGLDYFDNAVVPEPDANVDWFVALNHAIHDSAIGKYLLDKNPPIEVAIGIHKNMTAWMRFLSIRHPDPERRARYKAIYELREAELKRLLAALRRKSLRVVPNGRAGDG